MLNNSNFDEEFTQERVKFSLEGGAFLSTIFFFLEKRVSTEIPTAGTDGKSLLINPDFFLGLTHKQRIFLFAHEVMHVALMHMTRRGDRDQELWNIAGDYVINNELDNKNFGEVIPGSLINHDFDGLSTEEVYDRLQDSKPEFPKELSDILEPQEGEDKESLDEDIKSKVIGAIQVATMAKDFDSSIGSGCIDLTRLVENILNPKIDWRTQLQDYFSQKTKEEYSMFHRNKHFPDIYMPSRHSKGMGPIRCYIDVSGSVDVKQIQEYLAELASIKEVLNPDVVTIVPFADGLFDKIEILRDEEFPHTLDIQGYGGTNIKPVIEDWEDCELAIVFTDGYFYMPETIDKDDILWVIVDKNESFECSKGKIIYVN